MRPDRSPLSLEVAPSGPDVASRRHDRAVAGSAPKARRAAVRVDRVVTELRRGRPIRLTDGPDSRLVLAVETLVPTAWAIVAGQPERAGGIRLVLSAERAVAAGWTAPVQDTLMLGLPVAFDPDGLARLAGLAGAEAAVMPLRTLPEGVDVVDMTVADAAFAEVAVELARLARLVPAALLVDRLPADMDPFDDDVLGIGLADLDVFASDRAVGLARIAEAPVPLAGHEQCRFVLFRETTADFEHVAIVVGAPDPAFPVTVRLHSSCLTGDLFGSLRCDCGDQLRGAIERLQAEGGGVLLYLSQEGRGIGLANKLRAYTRQDAGLDTIDADRYLGFRGDERQFSIAARMLRELGIARVRLLTNNPVKIAALVEAGIEVTERLPIGGAVTRFNARYLATKRDRAGHLIDAPAEPAHPAA